MKCQKPIKNKANCGRMIVCGMLQMAVKANWLPSTQNTFTWPQGEGYGSHNFENESLGVGGVYRNFKQPLSHNLRTTCTLLGYY